MGEWDAPKSRRAGGSRARPARPLAPLPRSLAYGTVEPPSARGCAGSLWIARFEFTLRRIEQFLCISGPTLSDTVLDSDGTLWVLGTTGVPMVTRNALQPIHGGQMDMYIAHVTPSDSAPIMATHFGGDRLDVGSAIAIAPAGDSVNRRGCVRDVFGRHSAA